MTDEKLKQFKENIYDEIKQAKKQKALERAILKFVPKKKHGFLQIGATCVIPNQLNSYYLPFRKVRIKGYEITQTFGLVIICEGLEKPKTPFTFKVHVENVYHSVMDFAESFYASICTQIHDIQQCFSKNEIFSSQHLKKTTEMTARQLVHIKRKVEAKCRRKSKPNFQIPIN